MEENTQLEPRKNSSITIVIFETIAYVILFPSVTKRNKRYSFEFVYVWKCDTFYDMSKYF